MNVIYHCVGGTHSSAIAAAIHLGILPKDRKPDKTEILSIPYFDTLTKKGQGKIIFRGKDSSNNNVFTLSRQFVPQLVLPAINDTWGLAGGRQEDLLLIDTMPSVNLLMKIGGFSSRRLSFTSFGRPIVTQGTIKAYKDILKIVEDTCKSINKN